MSYDISIQLKEPQSRATLEKIIAKHPDVTDFRYIVKDTHYMEIDLEPSETGTKDEIAAIAFHIPYDFLSKRHVDFDFYFTLIQDIASEVDAPAFDRQLDVFLTDPEFLSSKPSVIQNAHQLSKLTYADGRLRIHFAYSAQEASWDLAEGTFLGIEKTAAEISNYQCHVLEASHTGKIAKADKKTKRILIYDSVTHAELAAIDRAGDVTHLKFISDHLLLSCSKNKTIKLWDINTLKNLKTFKGHLDEIADFILINDTLLVSSSIGGSLLFWDFHTAKCIAIVLHSRIINWWIVMDLNGNYDHNASFRGRIDFDFGKQRFTPGKGFSLDTSGGWNFSGFVPNTAGKHVKGMLKDIVTPHIT